MRNNLRFLLLGVSLYTTSLANAQSIIKRQHQIGETHVEVRCSAADASYVYSVQLDHGKRNYQIRLKGKEVQGDIKLPKWRDLVFNGTWVIPNKGMKADGLVLLPDWGLLGYSLEHTATDSSQGLTRYGNVKWRIDLASGQFEECPLDEIVIYKPYDYVLAERVLYIKKQATEDLRKPGDLADGFFYVGNKKAEQWNGMEIMGVPKLLQFSTPISIKRFINYRDAFMVIGQKKGGYLCRSMVFDQSLQNINNYFPSLVVFQSYAHVPYKMGNLLGNDMISRYRKGIMHRPDELFSRLILVPSQSFEGLYGVLSSDGKVEIPDGSLGLAPILTTEKVANTKDSSYLLAHFFVVPYPGAEDSLHFGIAGPDGKPSHGSPSQAVWKSWFIQESELLSKQVQHSNYHSDIIVAQGVDGKWQGYLPARYGSSSDQHSKTPYFPRPIGTPDPDPAKAIASTEDLVLRWDSLAGVKIAANKARIKAEADKWRRIRAARQDSLHQVWLRNQPPPAPRAPISIGSQWEGFTYTAQTTARYNQSVRSSTSNMSMRAYNSHLNAKIYRTW
jgi:hypothetical protein